MAASFFPEKARAPPALPPHAPPITKFKIGICQLKVTADKERNILHARAAVEEAAEKGAKLVLLPEIWNSPYSNDSFPVNAEDIDAGFDASPSTAMLSEIARRLHITLIGGSISERSGDKLYNTCCIYGPDGELIAKHRKIHLFDIDMPGEITFKESNTLTAGETPTVVDTVMHLDRFRVKGWSNWNWHLLRYSISRTVDALFSKRCSIALLPGSIQYDNGASALGTITRIKLYVATCSPARDAAAGYVAWGHSTLIGPFGEVLATTDHDEAIIISEIDYSHIELRRTNLPLEKQRRGDLYRLVDVQRVNSE